jgi:DNA-binding NarL/FixJ family response regulator
MARTILVAVRDLLFGSKIQEAGKRSGTPLQWASRFEKLSDVAAAKKPDVVIADLGEPGMVEELAAVRRALPNARILAFAGHTQEASFAQAEALGVHELFTKGQFSAQVEKILIRERGESEGTPS